jgi:7-alpha-hydroxysteroid dehydrogenase
MPGTGFLDRFRVDGQVAIITGAGRGIGAATAQALAACGADVVLTARTEPQLQQVARAVEAVGRTAVVVAADANDLDQLAATVDVAREAFGRADIVVNNVGGTTPQPFLETTATFLEQAFHFNVTTAFALSRAAVPLMLEHGGGSIVNIASVMHRFVDRGYVGYSTGKAALAQMTRLMAADLAPKIRVNAVAPGSIATEALEGVLTNDTIRSEMERRTPLKRIGEPDDIAAAVLYLASPAAAFVTGAVLEVSGGLWATNLALDLPDL